MEEQVNYSALMERINTLQHQYQHNLTQLAQMEMLLVNRTGKLNKTEKIAHVGSWEWDLKTNEVIWSDELYRILGFTPGEVTPSYEYWLERIYPEDMPISDKFAREIVKGETEVYCEYRVIHKDCVIRHISIRGQSQSDDENKPIRAFGVVQDITDRKQTQLALQLERDNFRNILETMNDLVYIVDGDYNIRYGNPILKEKFGPQIKKKCFVYFHDRDTPCEWCKNHSLFAGEALRWKCQFSRGDRTYDLMGSPLKNPDGSIYILEIMRDITDHKQAEEEKLALERQVLQAQKLESLGVLAGGIAHDFNNLLMTILGNADLGLLKLPPDSSARTYFREIISASNRAAELAKQMLAYSGKGQFVIDTIDGRRLLEDMSHMLDVLVTRQTLIKYRFQPEVPTFEGDVAQVRQTILNLVTNAVEAIGDGGGTITISTGVMECDRAFLDSVGQSLHAGIDKKTREGVYTYISVADTGCGMNAETLPRIFDPFFTTKFTGRGLGLSAVLGIMRGHKGTVNVSSEVGSGTTVKLLFPANALAVDPVNAEPATETVNDRWGGGGNVLLVDDEETVLEVAREMLECFGYRVVTAIDGLAAVEIFRVQPRHFVCVLMDLTMPRMDGEEAFQEMKRINPDVTVILCSGYNEQDATQNFAGKGLGGFIQKPFNMTTLKKKLMDVLPEPDHTG